MQLTMNTLNCHSLPRKSYLTHLICFDNRNLVIYQVTFKIVSFIQWSLSALSMYAHQFVQPKEHFCKL